MVAIVHRHEPAYLYRAWRFLTVTRENGDIVRLSWKLLASIMASCIIPAVAVAASLWIWAERVVVYEQATEYHGTRITNLEVSVSSLQSRDGVLQRLDQRLTDIDRRLSEIREEQRQDAKRNP
jgi:hypothetical protein